MTERCTTCGALQRLNRPLFDGERPPQLDIEIMRLKPKKGEIIVFRNLKTHEIQPLHYAVLKLREENCLPEGVEVFLFEGEVDLATVTKLHEASVQIGKLTLKMGDIVVGTGLPQNRARGLHIMLREIGAMPPGTALVTIPEGAKLETMTRPQLVELLNLLIHKKD